MKVLHLLKTSTGATWALRQVKELVARGVEIHVALPPGGRLVDAYRRLGVTAHELQCDLPAKRPWLWPSVASQLRSLVHDVRPEIIHSHFVGTTLTARLALGSSSSIPRLFQVPGPLHLEHPLFRTLELSTAGPSDFWIGSCKWTCQEYRRLGVPENRITLAYYGVDPDEFKLGNPGTLRTELGLGRDVSIVGMVAYMYAPKRYLGHTRGIKGHEDLIDALSILLREGENVVAAVVGGPWGRAHRYERKLKSYARSRCGDRVRFLGTRTDVPDLYADMNVVVHPSLSENVGGAAESLLLGVPTIATDVGGLPDLVEEGRTGWLVPARDPNSLSRAIREAIRFPEEAGRRALAGQHLAEEFLDVRQSARAVFRAYEQVLREGRLSGPGQRNW